MSTTCATVSHGRAVSGSCCAKAEASAVAYAVLRHAQPPLLELLIRFHEAHDTHEVHHVSHWLHHFNAILWLKLALLHQQQGFCFTLEFDLRQYLKLPVAVSLQYFHDHISL